MGLKQAVITVAVCVLVVVVVFVIAQILFVWLNGRTVPTPVISRDALVLGSGPKLKYAILGDSTTIAQGAEYEEGYALASAKHLAEQYEVTFLNVGVSGAVASDVAGKQLQQVVDFKPDMVLIAVGANDATHLTSVSSVEVSIKHIVNQLRTANPDVRIVITGAPAMDTVARFPWAVQLVAFWRVAALNTMFTRIVASDNLVFAPIADQTRQAFKNDPTLFAADKFHPNARGYALWTPIINRALDEAVSKAGAK